MNIDREIQLEILQKLADVYPNGLSPLVIHLETTEDAHVVIANAQYLAEHGLIRSGYQKRDIAGLKPEDSWYEIDDSTITAAGIDFLKEDGGLGAILGVVTVKLDASTIKALLLNHIDRATDVNHEQRSLAKRVLGSIGDQALRKLVDTLIEQGLKACTNTPHLIGMLQVLHG